MVEKPEYIQYVELQGGVLSVMSFHKFNKDIIKYIEEKKYEIVFETSQVSLKGKAKWNELIFKTKQEFYLHFKSNNEEDESFWLTIYYKPEKRNELIMFTTQILKPFKDGTTNDGAA